VETYLRGVEKTRSVECRGGKRDLLHGTCYLDFSGRKQRRGGGVPTFNLRNSWGEGSRISKGTRGEGEKGFYIEVPNRLYGEPSYLAAREGRRTLVEQGGGLAGGSSLWEKKTPPLLLTSYRLGRSLVLGSSQGQGGKPLSATRSGKGGIVCQEKERCFP